eukprot:TRINITY_DN533_c0_g1_i11.p1 TRINITY_DN533_c0_g1~~TRINITY_DN533_c0_g1_i11.p1  ORF type:complete len:107 (+),score=23.08 TRINITY_DN533_c0_g1_i11:631-951(+)
MEMVHALFLNWVNYLLHTKVQWSAITSATTSLAIAKQFASNGGVIFRLQVHSGRDIKEFSLIPIEEEVLLSPNSVFVVTKEAHKEKDHPGFSFINLLELSNSLVTW